MTTPTNASADSPADVAASLRAVKSTHFYYPLCQRAADQIEALRHACEEAVVALQRFGDHRPGCQWAAVSGCCTCGLGAVLAHLRRITGEGA